MAAKKTDEPTVSPCGPDCQVLPSSLAWDLGIHFTCPDPDAPVNG